MGKRPKIVITDGKTIAEDREFLSLLKKLVI